MVRNSRESALSKGLVVSTLNRLSPPPGPGVERARGCPSISLMST